MGTKVDLPAFKTKQDLFLAGVCFGAVLVAFVYLVSHEPPPHALPSARPLAPRGCPACHVQAMELLHFGHTHIPKYADRELTPVVPPAAQ
jgi:hypothetical protein